MKLLRVGPPNAERPCLLDPQGLRRDLSALLPDLRGEFLGEEAIADMRKLDCGALPLAPSHERIGPCVAGPTNFICIGLNYRDHAAETKLPEPAEPIIFLKSLGALSGPCDDVVLPPGSQKLDWEVELAIVIGRRAKNISQAQALDHICGYCICNDVSEREFQLEHGGTWDKGKGCDTFGPIGPWLVTKDEVPQTNNLGLWLEVDGKRMQEGNTRDMIFSAPYLVSYVSKFITLHPGDLIATGTPAGVGMGQKPNPIYLRAGQQMRLGVDGLGEQRQRVVAESAR